MAMLAGFFYALGNVTFGRNCSQLGFWGAGFPGPITFIVMFIYRVYYVCRTKQRTGQWVDKPNSNYWRVATTSSVNNSDFVSAAGINNDDTGDDTQIES